MFGGAPHEIADGYREGIQRLIGAVNGLRAVTIAAINKSTTATSARA